MKKVIFVLMAAAVYYIAGMYRQMPLMLLAVMDWILLVLLLILPRCLKRRLEVSFPLQNGEAEKGSEKRCLVHIGRTGVLPLKKVCFWIKVYDDKGGLLQKGRVQALVNALTGTVEVPVSIACCGIVSVQLDRVYVYDYLFIFSVKMPLREKLELYVLPKARKLKIRLPLEESASSLTERMRRKLAYQPDVGRFGSESREVRQIREYRVGDTMRHIHWNQSARSDALWIKEFEREDEAFIELLLDMRIWPHWKYGERDGFYEVVSALVLGMLQAGRAVRLVWYDPASADFMAVLIKKKAYRKRQAESGQKMIKCNLHLECYVVSGLAHGFCKEELRHRFTYEELEQELSGDAIFPLW